MARPPKKIVKNASPEKKSEKAKPQQQEDVVYSSEFLSSEDAMVQAEQEMGQLEVT